MRIPRGTRDPKPWVIEVNAGAYRPGADFDPGGRAPAVGDLTLLVPPDNPLPLSVP
jgi:hypothetical protein